MQKRGEAIQKGILQILKASKRPVSTREITIDLKVSWHPVMNHCLRLQMAGKIECFTIGKSTAWVIKK